MWRKRAGFSQERVAEILEMEELIDSHASVSRIERGIQRPSIVVIEAMARLYGTDIDSMINRPPPETAPPAGRAPGLRSRTK